MTALEVGNLLLLLGTLLTCMFLARGLCLSSFSLATPHHPTSRPDGRRLVDLAVAGAAAYVGRPLARAAVTAAAAAMLLGTVVSIAAS